MTADDVLIYQTVTDNGQRGPCVTCGFTWDACLQPDEHWLPCCTRCDHP
jgi:hypothetical protein